MVIRVSQLMQDELDWLYGVLDRIEALNQAAAACENLPLEFLRVQCRQATELLQTANLAVILIEIQLKVKSWKNIIFGNKFKKFDLD